MPSASTATSVNGSIFRFTGSTDAPLVPGSFIVTTDGVTGLQKIGIVDSLEFTDDGVLVGAGRILGTITDDGLLDPSRPTAFFEAAIVAADSDAIELVYSSAGATLNVGSLVESDGIGARLIPGRFNRHTFWCGQSGSGKTYALGVVLEQLLVHTGLPMVIFDPNADFVRLHELISDSDVPEHRALQERDIRILRPSGTGNEPLLARFTDFSIRSKAAILRLDPVVDRDEYNLLMHFEANGLTTGNHEDLVPRLRASTEVAAQALAQRIENLRLVDWEVWAYDGKEANLIVDERPDATVLDLGGFAFPGENLVVALSVLDDLWAKRESRRPILIVIDEAHNLCSPDNDSPLHRAVLERIIQIAAEGRKFGLWLLLSTQRPSKIHPSIISQCDNLALMRMSSPVDLDELATIFGFAPPELLASSPQFQQGEALFAGGFVPAPTLLKIRTRLTPEGGSDVRVPIR
ncbi:ATP-binding protein [Leifsonia sp. A12D58]|uniref:ATP-binding protein n=1 Tax=Leifsonia sp. A12D58 TaxID=3397674 RepID=UPI0039E12108